MNFFDIITISTVGLTTVAVLCILLIRTFELTRSSLSKMKLENYGAIDDEPTNADYERDDEPADEDDDADDDDEPAEEDDEPAEDASDDDDEPAEDASDDDDEPSDEAADDELDDDEPAEHESLFTTEIEDQKNPNIWYDSADGRSRYMGEWKNGLPNGKGIKETFESDTADYSVIEGDFVDGFVEGYAKQSFRKTWEITAPYYLGEFSRNQYNGFGEYHYGDYSYHKGQWRNSKMNGPGGYYSNKLYQTWVGTFCDDKKVVGEWVDGAI